MNIKWLGIQPSSSPSEQVVSTLGGLISIFLISLCSYLILGLQGALAIVPSMGASAVLLYAVPHGPLSQPWALFTGHLTSAVVGVTVAFLVPNMLVASGLAVGLAIGVMLLTRSTHPPGGATALAAVIGGDAIQQLGYFYAVVPVLLNCIIIFLVALAFNNIFAWRRYPAAAMRYKPINLGESSAKVPPDEYLHQAKQDLDAVVDVSTSQLRQIYLRAEQLRQEKILSGFDFELGGVYTNNRPGGSWSVRKIIDYAHHPDPHKELVIYRVLDGAHKNRTSSCTRTEFARWAKQKLKPANQ